MKWAGISEIYKLKKNHNDLGEVISLTDLIESRLRKQQEMEYYQQTLDILTQKIDVLNTEVNITTLIIDMIENERVLTIVEKKGKLLLLNGTRKKTDD